MDRLCGCWKKRDDDDDDDKDLGRKQPSWSIYNTYNNNHNIRDAKLSEIAKDRCDELIINHDYRKDDIDRNQKRRRCLWCFVKQRKKSWKLREQISKFDQIQSQRTSERKTNRLSTLRVKKKKSVRVKSNNDNAGNLLYDLDDVTTD